MHACSGVQANNWFPREILSPSWEQAECVSCLHFTEFIGVLGAIRFDPNNELYSWQTYITRMAQYVFNETKSKRDSKGKDNGT
jgi:hypothetical protein